MVSLLADVSTSEPRPHERPRTKTRLRGVVSDEPPAAAVAPRLIGRYEVVEVIGRGAMGVVYRARDPWLDRIVAIKTIQPPRSSGDRVRRAFLERFEREAKAAAGISHPAIVTIFDVGLDVEAPFLVMEYLPGETLGDYLDRERMPLASAVECARELASALGCAHRQRIVHRDVKPANVLYAGDSRWKLADFGIARLPDSDLTQVGVFMGTPGYAPPEAIREGMYTVQADVFAWGAVLYELLTGRIPYEGADTQTTNRTVLAGKLPSPRQHDPAIPEPVAQVTLTALHPDPKERYTDGAHCAQALLEAWQRSLSSGQVSLRALTTTMTVAPESSRRKGHTPVSLAQTEAVGAVPAAEVRTPAAVRESAAPQAPIIVESERTDVRPENRPAAKIERTGAQRDDAAQVIKRHEASGHLQQSSARGPLVAIVIALLVVGAVAVFLLMKS
jgi:eukaryotic-like serine/threonine-protein kinase